VAAPRPGDSIDVTRIEHDNLESAVLDNRRMLERVERKMDDLSRAVAELKQPIRSITLTNAASLPAAFAWSRPPPWVTHRFVPTIWMIPDLCRSEQTAVAFIRYRPDSAAIHRIDTGRPSP
jgi:hypothetical protein